MAEEEDVKIEMCGHKAHIKFRRAKPGEPRRAPITPCVLEPNHEGNHVYCIKVKAGIDRRSHALHFFEEESPDRLRAQVVMEMRGKKLEPDEDCALLYQFMKAWSKMRSDN